MAGQDGSGPVRAGRRTGRLVAAAALGAVLITAAAAALGTPWAWAGDRPAGFWYGTDSRTVTVPGPAPYKMPVIGGSYGGYIGMTGNWANLESCHKIVVWSAANAAQANTNRATYHLGVGTGVYWFMAGPGVDPHYNGTTTEAYSWGEVQAGRALADAAKLRVTYPVMWADIELPGGPSDYTPAFDNGWNHVFTSPCSTVVRSAGIATSVDRADFNGFAAYVTAHSAYKVGVYSAPGIWGLIFGTGSDASIRTPTSGPTSRSPAA